MFYPIQVTKAENGRFVVMSRDIPECVYSDKTEEEALKNAQEMLPGTLELFYRRKKKPFPLPSALQQGEIPIYVPAKVQAKMLFWNFLCSRGMSLAEASRELGQLQARVQCLVDLTKDKASIEAVESALEHFGQRLDLLVAPEQD